MRPTDVASRFVRFARLMLSELRTGLGRGADGDSRATGGHIELGTLPMARAVFLPELLNQFMTTHPAASVRVIETP